MEKESEYDEKHAQLYVGRIDFDPHRLIYATIILMVALAVYSEEAEPWSGTPFMDLMVVVFAPLTALSLAHAFSDALDVQIRTGKRLSAKERRHLLGIAVQYVAVGIPVVVLGLVLLIVEQDPRAVVRIAEVLGVASLFFWGAFAARRSGLARRRQWQWGTIYGLLGGGIILIELAFFPDSSAKFFNKYS